MTVRKNYSIPCISHFFPLQPGLDFNTTTQEYVGTPTMSKSTPKTKKGKKRKREEDPEDAEEATPEDAKEATPEAKEEKPEELSLATHAMSIMICGLTKRYKNIIGFHFTDDSFDAKECAAFITEAIQKVTDIGLKVKAVVMDMSTLNMAV